MKYAIPSSIMRYPISLPFVSFLRVPLLVFLILTGCVSERSPVTGEKERYGFSWEQEQQLGAEADVQISQQLGLYPDEAVQDYIAAVGERVLSSSDFRDADVPERYRDTEFTFRVLNSSVVNAFALPGGYVYVTRGLLAHTENEAQLAVVLGHEIGHVAGRHSARQALRNQLSQFGLVAGVLVGSQVLDGEQTEQLLGVGGTVLQVLLNKYSRDHEREADELGVTYAAREGYEAGEGAGFFRVLDRMAAQSGSRVPSWQSTHPEPAEREQTVLQLAREMESQYRMTVVNAEEFHQRIDGLVVGEDPRAGFVQDGIFYHPELRFQFQPPAGWRVQNETQAVLMMDPRQQALMVFELAPAASPQAAAEALSQQEGVSIFAAEDATVGGLSAVVVEGRATAPQGEVRLRNTFVAQGEHVYSFLGYTTPEAYPNYRDAFAQAMGSFGPLRDERMLDRQPARLRVVRAPRTAPFREFLPAVLPAGLTPQDFALLNQTELDRTVEAGEWLKLPR